jgi:hypothetical protein
MTILALALLLITTPAVATEMPRVLRGHWCFTKGDHGHDIYRRKPPPCPRAKTTLHVYRDGYFSFVDKGEINRPCNAITIERDSVGGWSVAADCGILNPENQNKTDFYFFPRPDGTLGIGE